MQEARKRAAAVTALIGSSVLLAAAPCARAQAAAQEGRWDLVYQVKHNPLRVDGQGSPVDLRYPVTAPLQDGTRVTYYLTAEKGITHVAATGWRLP